MSNDPAKLAHFTGLCMYYCVSMNVSDVRYQTNPSSLQEALLHGDLTQLRRHT